MEFWHPPQRNSSGGNFAVAAEFCH
jgi:hypothetical protein